MTSAAPFGLPVQSGEVDERAGPGTDFYGIPVKMCLNQEYK